MSVFRVIGTASAGFVLAVEAPSVERAIEYVSVGEVDTSDIRFPKDFTFEVSGVEAEEG